jgi:hypothetical protein
LFSVRINPFPLAVRTRKATSGEVWLTGLIVPYDTDKFGHVAKLAIEALQG